MSFALDVPARGRIKPAGAPPGRAAHAEVPLADALAVYDRAIAAKAAGLDWTEADTQRAAADARRHFLSLPPGGPRDVPVRLTVSALGGILPPAGGGAAGAAPPGGQPAPVPGQPKPMPAGLKPANESSQVALLAYMDELAQMKALPEGSPEREEAEQRADMLWEMIHGGQDGPEDQAGPQKAGDAKLMQALASVPDSVTQVYFLDTRFGGPKLDPNGQQPDGGDAATGGTSNSGNWTRYQGPRGGTGWRNVQTGRVVYTGSANPPGHVRRQRQQSAGRAESISKRVLAHYQAPDEEHAPAEEELQELATHLPQLNIDQLRNTRNRLLASWGDARRKEPMVAALRKHVADLVATRNGTGGRLFPDFPGRDKQAELDAEAKAKKGPRPNSVQTVPTSSLKVDPERFQFKQNVDKKGVTDEFRGVEKFNPDLAGVVAAWHDPETGNRYVVNGHHRHEIAERTGHPTMAVRWLKAANAQEARAKGALINIAEGKGTPVDAAKFMRDMAIGPEDLARHGISLKGAMARDAVHLKNVSDPIFNRVARGQMDTPRAVAIGEHLGGKPDLQNQLVSYIDRREEATGREWTPKMVAEAAREVASSPTTQKDQGGLFGGTQEESRLEERAALKGHVRAHLAQARNDFAAVGSERRAGAVAGAGNQLNVEANQKKAQEHAQAAELFDRVANLKGPVSSLINEYAERYANAPKSSKLGIARQLADAVHGLLRGGPAAVGADQQPQQAGPAGAGVAGGGGPGPEGGGAPGAERGQLPGGPGAVPAGGLSPKSFEARPGSLPGEVTTGTPEVRAFDPEAVEGRPPPKDKPITLMYGGSFSPVHEGHLEQGLKKARDHLEAQGYTVGKVLVAPSADKLLRAKLGDQLVPLKDRTEMVRRALAGRYPDVEATSGPGEEAESFAGKLRRTQLADWAAREHPGTRVVNVTGEDAVPPGAPPLNGRPALFGGAKGSSHEGYYYIGLPRDETDPQNISSGKIRRAVQEGRPLEPGWMHPDAEAYYREHMAQRRAAGAGPQAAGPAHVSGPGLGGGAIRPHEMDSAPFAESPNLTGADRREERRLQELARQEYPRLRDEFLGKKKADGSPANAIPDPAGGYKSITLNTDEWREHLPGYTGTNASVGHEAASWLNKRLLAEALETQKGKGNGQFLVLAGGGGSGKGSAVPEFYHLADYPIVLDQTSAEPKKLERDLDRATAAGYKPSYVFVDRPVEAAWGGVVGRALKSRAQGRPARTVEMRTATEANQEARKAALDLLRRRPEVEPHVLDNTSGKPGRRRLLTDRAEAIRYLEGRVAEEGKALAGGLTDRLHAETVRRHEAGEIPEDIARGLLGGPAWENYQNSRKANPPAGGANPTVGGEPPAEVPRDQGRVPGPGTVPPDHPAGAVAPAAAAARQPELPGVARRAGPGPAAGPGAAGGARGAGGQAEGRPADLTPPEPPPAKPQEPPAAAQAATPPAPPPGPQAPPVTTPAPPVTKPAGPDPEALGKRLAAAHSDRMSDHPTTGRHGDEHYRHVMGQIDKLPPAAKAQALAAADAGTAPPTPAAAKPAGPGAAAPQPKPGSYRPGSIAASAYGDYYTRNAPKPAAPAPDPVAAAAAAGSELTGRGGAFAGRPAAKADPHALAARLATGGTATAAEARQAREAYTQMPEAGKAAYAKAIGVQGADGALPHVRDALVDRALREGQFRGEQAARGLKDVPDLHEGGLFGPKGVGESAGLFDQHPPDTGVVRGGGRPKAPAPGEGARGQAGPGDAFASIGKASAASAVFEPGAIKDLLKDAPHRYTGVDPKDLRRTVDADTRYLDMMDRTTGEVQDLRGPAGEAGVEVKGLSPEKVRRAIRDKIEDATGLKKPHGAVRPAGRSAAPPAR